MAIKNLAMLRRLSNRSTGNEPFLSTGHGLMRRLERFRPDQLVDTSQIGSGTALRLFAVAPLRLSAALAHPLFRG